MVPPTGSNRRSIRLMLLIILMAIVTHLCSAQLAHGQEKFLTAPAAGRPVTVEIRREAAVVGNEIRFRQVARWSASDEDVLEPIGDLVIARLEKGSAFRGIAVGELKKLLEGAGVNVAFFNFAGASTCTVNRSDLTVAPEKAIVQWHAAKAPEAVEKIKPAKSAAPAFVGDESPEAPTDSPAGTRSLRQALTDDLAVRLKIPAESLQITFKGKDDKLLDLQEPLVKFSIDGRRTGDLGEVGWTVNVTSGAGNSKTYIDAVAWAWLDQLVVVRPLSSRQVITADDVIEKRTLSDKMPSDTLVKRDQAVGQMASRELRAGQVVTSRALDPVQLVRAGQYVAITHSRGGVSVKITAKALESGAYGQSIRVQNETTRETYRVSVTGQCEAAINPPPTQNTDNRVAAKD